MLYCASLAAVVADTYLVALVAAGRVVGMVYKAAAGTVAVGACLNLFAVVDKDMMAARDLEVVVA